MTITTGCAVISLTPSGSTGLTLLAYHTTRVLPINSVAIPVTEPDFSLQEGDSHWHPKYLTPYSFTINPCVWAVGAWWGVTSVSIGVVVVGASVAHTMSGEHHHSLFEPPDGSLPTHVPHRLPTNHGAVLPLCQRWSSIKV